MSLIQEEGNKSQNRNKFHKLSNKNSNKMIKMRKLQD